MKLGNLNTNYGLPKITTKTTEKKLTWSAKVCETLRKFPSPGVMTLRPIRNLTSGRGKPLVWQVMVTLLALSRHIAAGLSITNEEIGSLVATGGGE